MCSTAFLALIVVALLSRPATGVAADSICYGTSSAGHLEGGVQIPESGANFSPVSLGRTFVHSKVAATIRAAYEALELSAPDKVYVYGESGWREGGRIKPHRTHQNGTAVDFMVPVLDKSGKSIPLPTGIMNKFGYAIEFDAQARYGELRIDLPSPSIYTPYTRPRKVTVLESRG